MVSSWIWKRMIDTLIQLWMPLIVSYHILSSNLFLNISVSGATGLEKWGDQLLAPFQYLCAGKTAHTTASPEIPWTLKQRFDYQDSFWIKCASSALALAPSTILGCLIKGLAFFDPKVRARYASIEQCLTSTHVDSHIAEYRALGLEIVDPEQCEIFEPLGLTRRPGDERNLACEKEALRVIGQLLTEANIPWWVDCGTCLGTYRYGGAIPWDDDLDIAVLLPDHENVKRVLNQLDPQKYMVQDWSCRDRPDMFLKVYLYETRTTFDIYHFAIEEGQIRYLLTIENNLFTPEWFKIRERRFTTPVNFSTVFPLKQCTFDGIPVFVPNRIKEYLQRCYGENLAPARIYDPSTCQYEKDLTHPYWQQAYVH